MLLELLQRFSRKKFVKAPTAPSCWCFGAVTKISPFLYENTVIMVLLKLLQRFSRKKFVKAPTAPSCWCFWRFYKDFINLISKHSYHGAFRAFTKIFKNKSTNIAIMLVLLALLQRFHHSYIKTQLSWCF